MDVVHPLRHVDSTAQGLRLGMLEVHWFESRPSTARERTALEAQPRMGMEGGDVRSSFR